LLLFLFLSWKQHNPAEMPTPMPVPIHAARDVATLRKPLVVTAPTVNSKAPVKLLEHQGWTLLANKVSHHIFVHSTRGGHISVPHYPISSGLTM
jgi:predicted RNA binding protein YcfA (HicA-like mRNA interferase family)